MNLQENIRTLLKEEYGRKYILYRGVGLDEAIKSCETGHLVYYSRDPMSRDWEVIEYGLGDAASEMSDEEIDEYVNNIVPWVPNRKGVNLTSDLDNAKGYSDIVLEINLVGYDYAEFSDVHIFAKNPEDCKIKSVYYNGKEYSKEEFLDITKSLQESIKKILREELKSTFFRRRVDLKKVKKLLSIMAQNVYDNTKSYEQFKYELTLWAVEHIMWDEYELGWDDLQEQEEIKFVEEVSDLFEKDIKLLYNSYKKE